MKYLPLLCTIFSFNSFASYIVYQDNQIKTLIDRINVEKIMVKKKWGRVHYLSRIDLGVRKTPFHYDNQDKVIAYYQNYDLCFKLNISERITARNINCNISKIDFKIKNFEEFELISKDHYELYSNLNDEFTLKEFSYSYPGFSFPYFMREEFIGQNLPTPLVDQFSFTLKEVAKIAFNKYNFSLNKKVYFQRDKFHFFDKKEIIKDQKITLRDNDYVFTNHQGELMVFRGYLDSVIDYNYMEIPNDYIDYLDSVVKNFYPYKSENLCFVDFHANHTNFDCEYMATRKKSYVDYKKFELLRIDLNKKQIDLI